MRLEVHTVPSIYEFKRSKYKVSDMISISTFVHEDLKDGGDPRKVHHACPDLKLVTQTAVSTKITDKGQEFQKTNLPVTIKEGEIDAED